MVIIGRGQCLDLEEFSVSDTPRNGRPWEKFRKFSKPRIGPTGEPKIHRSGTELRKSRAALGLPYGFWVTRVVSVLLSILWLLLLINVAAVKDSTWYLLLVGALGMFQNGILAAMERPPGTRNIPLRHADTITAKKVMDGLMDFDFTYKCGRPLLAAFFPGDLRPDEKDWWDGKPNAYDKAREEDRGIRGVPRRFLPPIKTASDPDRFKPEPDFSELSDNSPKAEKSTGNPFSDPNTSKTSDPSTSSPPRPLSVSWSARPQVSVPKFEPPVPRSGQNRVTSPTRSSLRRQVLTMDTTKEGFEQSGPSSINIQIPESAISSLSAEEVRESARSPDWAY
jgi:hypothetical protein